MNTPLRQAFNNLFNDIKNPTSFLDLPPKTQAYLIGIYFKNVSPSHQQEIINEANERIKGELICKIIMSLMDSSSDILMTNIGSEIMEGIILYLTNTLSELFDEALHDYKID